MKSSYNLNEQTLLFINDLGQVVEDGIVYTTADLVDLFKESMYYNDVLTTYSEPAVKKAIGYAVTRSEQWNRIKKGYNQKDSKLVNSPKENRNKAIVDINIKPHNNKKENIKTQPPNKEMDNHRLRDSPFRKELIHFLTENLYNALLLKKEIKDDGLRKYHFTKGTGEDLYFLTESFYRQKNLDSKKHSISDFITQKAVEIIESGETSNKLIYEHMVPKNIYISVITRAAIHDQLTYYMIYELLDKYFYVCTIAKNSENEKLPSRTMGEGWDQINPFYRYEQADIVFFPNIYNESYKGSVPHHVNALPQLRTDPNKI
ncbi:hypothetical protein [Alkalihalobacterium elongatum]|uniref:hypothetical protein n=1 Tax=Alkalihalobacterium elongatum TaxID=2675466 RepID=UPI001C1F9A08|nr:hypothetical protein [Alkalihalobacterium elongatum]